MDIMLWPLKWCHRSNLYFWNDGISKWEVCHLLMLLKFVFSLSDPIWRIFP
jgi:hypothetical protein